MTKGISQFEAVGLALAGYTCWVLADTNLKVAGGSKLPAYEVVAFVGLAVAGLLGMHGLWRGKLRELWPKRPGPQLVRSSLDLGNNICVVIALRHLPLALFYILIFLAPMVTTLLAAAFLGERLEWRNGLATIIGFGGVVAAVNPFGAEQLGDWTGYLACMVCVACFSANMVWSRVMTQTEKPESMTFFSGLVQAVAGGAAMLHGAEPLTGKLPLVLLATGGFCVVGSLCFFVALKNTTAATVSQYHYSQLLTGALVAWLIWRERVTPAMFLGASLIIGAGIYTAAVSYRRRERVPALQT